MTEYLFDSGSKYIGEMHDDKFNGQGIFYYYNGDKYEGNFINDKMNGKGTYKYNNDDIYFGDFSDDKFNGIGTFKYKNGCLFKGKFKDDLRIGKFINKENNKLYEVVFQNDKEVTPYKEITEQDLLSGKYQKINISSIDDLF